MLSYVPGIVCDRTNVNVLPSPTASWTEGSTAGSHDAPATPQPWMLPLVDTGANRTAASGTVVGPLERNPLKVDPTTIKDIRVFQTIKEGVVLSVTPQIAADGIINMSIMPSITERTGTATSRLGDQVPIVSVRETDTLVRVHQRETIVIAGLMQDRTTVEKSKVPVLGDVPVVGGLFRRDERAKRKTDLVILLTPTVMTPGEIAAAAAVDQQRLYEAQRAPVRK